MERILSESEHQIKTMDNDIQSPRLASYLKKKRDQRSKYASFRRRTTAYSIDSMIVSLISTVAGWLFKQVMGVEAPKNDWMADAAQVEFDQYGNIIVPTQTELMGKTINLAMKSADQYIGYNWPMLFLNMFLVPLLYFSFCAASKYQATPGMRYCRIKITDQYGVGLTLSHAMARTLCHFLTGLTFGIGFFTMTRHPKKRALHDVMTQTEVRNVPKGSSDKEIRQAKKDQNDLLNAIKQN